MSVKNSLDDLNERQLLIEINSKLEVLILLLRLQGKSKDEKIKTLKAYDGSLSKREIEKVTGIDRHEF